MGRRKDFDRLPFAELEMPPVDRRGQEKHRIFEREYQRLAELNRQSFVQAIEFEATDILGEDEERIVENYHTGIYRRVVASWSWERHIPAGMQAKLLVELKPTGRMVNVTVAESSGNAAFDGSIEAAVNKAREFEVPAESGMFERYV